MNLPENFSTYLEQQEISPATVKNYLADINQFLAWLFQKIKIDYRSDGKDVFRFFTVKILEEYKKLLMANNPPNTVNRRFSALRKFGQFAQKQGWLTENPALKIKNVYSATQKVPTSEILARYQKYLKKQKVSSLTIKNYLSDLRHFLTWLEAT